MKPLILLVEAPGADRSLQALALESQGWEVPQAVDVGEALAWLEKGRPDLVVVGGSVVGVGSLELLCRMLESLGTPLRVLASKAEQEVLRRQGVRPESFLARPLTLGALVEGVRAALPPHEQPPEGWRRPLVLIADDDPVGRKLLQLHLAPFRFEVVTASDGRAALDLALRRHPDLVVADVLMPRLDGFRLCLELLGLSGESWAGTYEAFLERVHPEDREGLEAALTAHLERDVPYDVAFRMLHATVGYRHCVARGRVLRDAHGQPTRMAGILGDITEQLRLYRDAQEAVRARDEFLTVAAHELRTPLTTLRLRLQGLSTSVRAEGVLSAHKAARALEAADRQVQRLASLVESLLDVSQLQGHAPKLDVEETDLSAVVREAVTRSEESAARAGCLLVLGELPPTPGHWDAARMSQVVLHLLSNAVKFGPGKPVEVELRNRADAAVLRVRDHGIGIAPERGEGSSFVITLPRRGPGN